MKQLLCPIAKAALATPQAPAILTPTSSITYETLDSAIQCTQHYLLSLNLPHKMIATLAHNTLETLLTYFAALREGFSVFLLSPKEPRSLLEEKLKTLSLPLISLPQLTPYKRPLYPYTIPEDLVSTYLYTSGSSATPKIAALKFKNHYYSALGLLEILDLSSSSHYLLSLPLYHVSGLSILFRTFMSGATLVFPSESSIVTQKISHLSLVTTQYMRLLQDPIALSSPYLKAILLGGSAFSHHLLEQGIEKHLPLYLSYGLTEMGSTVTCNPLIETKNVASSGFLLPYRELKIDEKQQLWVGGETLFKGYYSPKRKKIVPVENWFNTKDVGNYFSTEGLKLQGRGDRLIISGGENIQPEEIERDLLSIPGIHKAVILPLEDPLFGHIVIAIVATDLPSNFIEEKLSLRLPRYKLPKHYLPWPAHLKHLSWKISATVKEALMQYARSTLLKDFSVR